MTLEVTEISEAINKEFYKGESKIITYRITNKGSMPYRNIRYESRTVDPDGIATKKNYVTKQEGIPKEMMIPGDYFDIKVHLNIPENYNEKYLYKSGGNEILIQCPMDVEVSVFGTEYSSTVYINE